MNFRIEDSETSKLTKQALVKNNDANVRSMSHTQRACEVQLSAWHVDLNVFCLFRFKAVHTFTFVFVFFHMQYTFQLS